MCVACGSEVAREEETSEEHAEQPVVRLSAEEAEAVKDQLPVALDVDGRKIALARAQGRWFAFDDTCTHQGCSLAAGTVQETSIVCPCHGGTFDMASGHVLAGPPPSPIQTYRVQIGEAYSSELVA
jgi:3-phenylpropionate/trans-cinnamate dioxygenase ferredoxin subunit